MNKGFSRAKPPTIRKVDLGNAEEVVELLNDVKLVAVTPTWVGMC